MHIRYLKILLVTFVLMSFMTSCVSTRMTTQQAKYEQELQFLAKANLPIEEKLDRTAKVFDDVLQESMEYSRTKHTNRHISQFTSRNKEPLNIILDQLEKEMKAMSTVEKVYFSVKILRKPYIRSFLEVVPKVEKKIGRKLRQIRMFGRFLSILKPGLF